jgi:steroid 5-alpha reductase family enzyme
VLPSWSRAVWPALVGALAVFYACIGGGAWPRRSAIAWMVGAWGARLAVQGLYTRAMTNARRPDAVAASPAYPSPRAVVFLVTTALVCSLPALLAAFNPAPELSPLELAACAIWLIGFAGETTADRQRLRFAGNPANAGVVCRTGVWRYSGHADRIFTALVWLSFGLFAVAAWTGVK